VTPMTCGEFEERVHDFVRMELLDVSEREAMLEHAAQCSKCSERMSDAIALAEATQAGAESAPMGEAPARIEAVVLAAFREHHQRRSWRLTFEWVGAGVAAAVLLAFLWTMSGGSKSQPTPVQKSAPAASQSGIPLDAKVSFNPNLAEITQAARVTAPAPGRRAVKGGTYAASDFVPVPYAGSVTPDDPGMVVRVQLTRSSLAQLGYPVAETPDEELISADVLVGEDGWPRGVKLVQ
jgi:hypothetical protein